MAQDLYELELELEDETVLSPEVSLEAEAFPELNGEDELSTAELLESFDPEEFADGEAKADSSSFALMRAIPDSPDYKKYIPLKYRLDAKAIVGKLAVDLQELKTPSANDLRKWAGDIYKFVTGGSIAAPVKLLVMTLKNIPAGYMAAAAKIAKNWSASGFSRGVVMGANGKSVKFMLSMFGRRDIVKNNFFPYGTKVAIANYSAGLLAGYVQGRSLSQRQHKIFWHELGYHMGDQSYRGPMAQWSQRDWIDWYVSAAAVFRREHLTA